MEFLLLLKNYHKRISYIYKSQSFGYIGLIIIISIKSIQNQVPLSRNSSDAGIISFFLSDFFCDENYILDWSEWRVARGNDDAEHLSNKQTNKQITKVTHSRQKVVTKQWNINFLFFRSFFISDFLMQHISDNIINFFWTKTGILNRCVTTHFRVKKPTFRSP